MTSRNYYDTNDGVRRGNYVTTKKRYDTATFERPPKGKKATRHKGHPGVRPIIPEGEEQTTIFEIRTVKVQQGVAKPIPSFSMTNSRCAKFQCFGKLPHAILVQLTTTAKIEPCVATPPCAVHYCAKPFVCQSGARGLMAQITGRNQLYAFPLSPFGSRFLPLF